jgi:hypothetical protein
MKQSIPLENSRWVGAVQGLARGRGFGVALGNEITQAPAGTVCLANDSLLRQSEYIEELTTFAISYDGMVGNKLARLRDLLSPARPSSSRIVRLTTYDENEPFQTVAYNKIKRAPLADFETVPQRIASKSDLQVNNRGLSVVLDRDQLTDKPEWQQMHTKWLMDLMLRATILEAVSLLETSAIVTNLVWDTASQPDLDIKNNIINLANTTGFYPNAAVAGDAAALIRSVAYEGQLTAGSIARAMKMTEDELATAWGVDKAIVNAERYVTAGTTATKQEIIGSNVLLFSSYGGDLAVYVTPIGVKKIILTVENYEYLHVQHTTGLQQLAIVA